MSSVASKAQSATGDLLDVNVWLALAIDEHPHHRAALKYWSSHPHTQKLFCRVSAMGFVRLLTQPKLMAEGALDLAGAWDLYERYSALPTVGMLTEPGNVDHHLAQLVATKLPARLLTDAYLAALTLCAQLRLVTFDKDFDRFAGIAVCRLSPT
jgi:uncharacterized protein